MSITDYMAGPIANIKALSATQTISNSTTETDVLTFTLPGGLMQANGRLLIEGNAKPNNNTGSDETVTIRIYRTPSGGAEALLVVLEVTVPDIVLGSTTQRGVLEVKIVNLNDAAQQFFIISHRVSEHTTTSGITAAVYDVVKGDLIGNDFDSTIDTDFRVTVQLSVASASFTFAFGPAWVDAIYIP